MDRLAGIRNGVAQSLKVRGLHDIPCIRYVGLKLFNGLNDSSLICVVAVNHRISAVSLLNIKIDRKNSGYSVKALKEVFIIHSNTY